MQQKLAQIATIPIIIQSTLQSVSRTFDAFLPAAPPSVMPSLHLSSVSALESEILEGIDEIEDCISIDSLENSSADGYGHHQRRRNIVGVGNMPDANDDNDDDEVNMDSTDDKSSLTDFTGEADSKSSSSSMCMETPISTSPEPTEVEMEKMKKQTKVSNDDFSVFKLNFISFVFVCFYTFR